jgi:DNA-binding GntR family transcriptional regulator
VGLPDVEELTREPVLKDRVRLRLEALIVSGTMSAGSRLVETELAQLLGVSRGPIREALLELSRDGFVDIRTRQGSFVHVPTTREIHEFFDVRYLLELEATRLATAQVSPGEAQELLASVEAGAAAVGSGEDPFAETVPGSLHDRIIDIAGNNLLAELLRTLHRRVRWYVANLGPDLSTESWEEHATIATAIASRDVDAAVSAMASHLERARATYLAALQQTNAV